MINTDTLRVQPITYKLNIDDEALKKLRPFFKLHSGSYSKITKTIGKPKDGSPKGDDQVKLQRKEKGQVTVELWDRNSSKPDNLIGKGELNYDSLSNKEGQYEEWIPLYDRDGHDVGKALVEVNITPVDKNLSIDDIYHRSIDDFNHSFKRAIEDMNRTFEHFDRFALPGFKFPSLLGPISHRHEAIEPEKAHKQSELQKSPQKKLTQQKSHQETQLSKQDERKNQVMTHRRSLFDNAFEDMNKMFERTLEDMHNRFEEMSKEMFSGFGNWIEDEEDPLKIEDDNYSNAHEKMDIEKPRSSRSEELSQSKKESINHKKKTEIKDQPLKHSIA